jgi:hypothetical protein
MRFLALELKKRINSYEAEERISRILSMLIDGKRAFLQTNVVSEKFR